MKEIERKFLVKESQLPPLKDGISIMQGYLSTDITHTVRVRTEKGHLEPQATICVKGVTTGITRDEYEYLIPYEDAMEMLDNMCHDIIVKKRYIMLHDGRPWHLDVFRGDNEGLMLVEVELDSEGEKVLYPDWADVEVSNDARYYNSNLAQKPFKTW